MTRRSLGHAILLMSSIAILAIVKTVRITSTIDTDSESGLLSVLAAGCVLAVLLTASCQARSYTRWRYSLLLLSLHVAVYLLAAAQVVDLVHDSSIWNYDSSQFIVSGAAVVVTAGLVAKAVIGAQLVAHASDATWTRHKGIGGGPGVSQKPALLRSQISTGRRLMEAVLADPNIGSGHVVQLVGHWGSGKSTILRDFASRMANNDLGDLVSLSGENVASPGSDTKSTAPAVAMIHVWRHEDDQDLHRAMVEAIIGAHLILEGERLISYRWLRIPSALLIARHLRAITLSLTLSLRGSEVKAESIKVPDLFAQRSLDYFLTSGRRTVVILDEIDRATPEVAQAVLTLVRRSLDVAACTTVLAYAEQIVRFKTMNPLSPLLPDIRSSVEALLSIHVGPPQSKNFDDTTLYRTSDDGSGNWFDQSDWLRRQWLLSQRPGDAHYTSVDDFYRVIEQKYLSSNLVTIDPILLFTPATARTSRCNEACTTDCTNGNEAASIGAQCELCALLRSPDLRWRLRHLFENESSEYHANLVHHIRARQDVVLRKLHDAAISLAEGCPASKELLAGHGLPDWLHPFQRFIEALTACGVPAPDANSGPNRGESAIGELLDANLPIRRLVSAWVADLDDMQRAMLPPPARRPRETAETLASRFVRSALRVACDNIHRHAPHGRTAGGIEVVNGFATADDQASGPDVEASGHQVEIVLAGRLVRGSKRGAPGGDGREPDVGGVV